MREKNISVDGVMLKEKANQIAFNLQKDNFNCSNGSADSKNDIQSNLI
jgi:hypothetical protein